MKIINFKKRVFKVIFSIALLAVTLNITSVPTTSAKFVDEKDPVLVYSETLSGIKPGSFYLYQIPKLNSDTNELTFSVAVGRSTIGNGSKVSEDYILDFDNISCQITNVSTNNGDYMISYDAGNDDYAIKYVEFVCSNVQSNFSLDIQIHEILNNDVRFDNTRGTLTVTYEEETPTITFDTLIDDMLEYLKTNLDKDIVKDDVIEYANKKGVTEENPNYRLIPGAIYNETTKFTTDLRDDFAKYMFNKKYEGEDYKDSVEYINKVLEEDGSPISDFFKLDYSNKIAYFISYKDNIKIIKIDKNNNITINEIKDVINDVDVITLYVVADDINNVSPNDILAEINKYSAQFKKDDEDYINGGISIDYIREHEEQTIDEDLEDEESELEKMKQDYNELLKNIKNNIDSTTTRDFIDSLELDENNPFYQRILSGDTNPLYYIYYEISPIETETYSLNEQNKIYLTLIEMNEEGITISALDSKLEEILKEGKEIKIYTLEDTSDDISNTLEAMLVEIGFTAYEKDNQANSLVYKITGNYEKIEEDDGEDQEEPDESDNEGTGEEGETPDNTGDDSEKQPEEDNDNITDDSNVDEDNDDSQDINDDNKNNDEENQDNTLDNEQDSSNDNLNNDENNEGENADYSDTSLNNSEYENEYPELLNNNEDIILG